MVLELAGIYIRRFKKFLIELKIFVDLWKTFDTYLGVIDIIKDQRLQAAEMKLVS